MLNYVVVGTGNVSFHIVKHLVFQGKNVVICGRNNVKLLDFAKTFSIPYVSNVALIHPTSFVIICVPDKAVYEVVSELPKECKVVYTSGSVELRQFNHVDIGVLYPLQTFSKNRFIQLNEVPFLVETFSETFRDDLVTLANTFSSNVRWIDSGTRKKIHLTAVFCNNFTNHLLNLAQQFSMSNQIDFSMFYPLIKETISKAIDLGANESQTGPAKRNDLETINKHTDLLIGDLKTIYIMLTNSILENNGYSKL